MSMSSGTLHVAAVAPFAASIDEAAAIVFLRPVMNRASSFLRSGLTAASTMTWPMSRSLVVACLVRNFSQYQPSGRRAASRCRAAPRAP